MPRRPQVAGYCHALCTWTEVWTGCMLVYYIYPPGTRNTAINLFTQASALLLGELDALVADTPPPTLYAGIYHFREAQRWKIFIIYWLVSLNHITTLLIWAVNNPPLWEMTSQWLIALMSSIRTYSHIPHTKVYKQQRNKKNTRNYIGTYKDSCLKSVLSNIHLYVCGLKSCSAGSIPLLEYLWVKGFVTQISWKDSSVNCTLQKQVLYINCTHLNSHHQ